MIAVDTNPLVWARCRESIIHEEAASIVRGLAEGSSVWAIRWPRCYEFIGVAANPRRSYVTLSTQIWCSTSGSPMGIARWGIVASITAALPAAWRPECSLRKPLASYMSGRRE